MKDLARRGAQSRLSELVAEMDSILQAFPDLGQAPARPGAATRRRKLSEETRAKMRASWARRKAAAGDTQEGTAAEAPRRKKRTLSAAARARISAAQKKRWAAVKKAGVKR